MAFLHGRAAAVLAVLAVLLGPTALASESEELFATRVRPTLEARCFRCHGEAAQRSGLRLDVREAALTGGDSGSVIVPGKSAESRLARLVAGEDASGLRMPPEGEGDPVATDEIAAIRAWIDSGAEWPDALAGLDLARKVVTDHWAYHAPERPAPPATSDAAWVRSPADAFVLARLDREGLAPSAEADRATLLRRLSLDLTGLPPSLEELDAFLADVSPGAYERQVDRLLASRHYGERRASHWLDLARYADTHGFEKDPRRTMWRWRDWVIDAFNRDLPYDQFVVEQLAGDLLPNATEAQVIATGFHRNTMINEEGGVDPEEARYETLLDRVSTTASVFLGTTLACAQCHTHKFDPFTQREYFRFLAFFDGDDEPAVPAPTPEIAATRAAMEREIRTIAEGLRAPAPTLDAAQAEWEREREARLVGWRPLAPASATSSGGATATALSDGSILLGGANPPGDVVTVAATVDGASLAGATALRVEALTHESLPQRGPGRHGNASFVLTSVEASIRPVGGSGEATPLAFVRARADYEQAGNAAATAVDGDPRSGWAIDAWMDDAHRVDRTLVLDLAEPIAAGAVPFEIAVVLRNGSPWPEANLGRFRLSIARDADAARDFDLPAPVVRALANGAAGRDEADRSLLRDHFRAASPATAPARERLEKLRATMPVVPTALVLRKRAEPRVTHLRVRGAYTSPGERVTPGVPAVFPPLDANLPPDRLALARWIASPENPLTARVEANRIWERFFGRGLVATSEDFGTQGERPSHLDLLDWLATELVRLDWSEKALVRTIVLSSTYRQSSRVTPSLLERDPENRLFARGPRHRVDAETVRDVALAASGLLEPKVGGPSVFPPQPDGIWTMIYSADKWIGDSGPRRYRRGLYTFWRRTAPYPSMTLFDAPSREVACTRRPRTNTPLQALVTLNDPAFVEAAVALAARARDAGEAPASRVEAAFRLCTARRPEPAEIERLLALYLSERRRFEGAPGSAVEFVSGSRAAPLVVDGDAVDLAAWTVVANVLLNLDETLTKE